MTSILESDYVEPERPYSQKELIQNRIHLYKRMRLSQTKAHHQRCDHFYLVKENGRKEKQMKEENSNDVGNCSVCWKISKTHRRLKDKAKNLVSSYCNAFYEEPKYLYYGNTDLEMVFYKWLYEESN